MAEKNLAVLVVDMQEPFLTDIDELMPKDYGSLLISHANLLAYCAKQDIPVAYAEISNDFRTAKLILEQIAKVPRHKRIKKDSDCAFRSSEKKNELVETLRKWKVSTVYITGIYAKHCVLTTAYGAKKSGFGIITAPQLIADCSQEDKQEAIFAITKIGLVVSHYTRLMP